MNLSNKPAIAAKTSILVITYVTLIALWAMVWLLVGDVTWWLTLLNRVVPYFFVPVPILLALMLLARRFKSMSLLVVPLLIFGSLYYPYLWPTSAPTETAADLSVMTYNILFSNAQYDAVANIILTHRPDLVALQEVQPEMMDVLKERLAAEYPYFLMGFRNRYGTTAVFSQHLFIESYVLDLQADRPAVVVKTEVNGRVVTFIAAHLLAYGLWWVDLADVPTTVVARTADQNRQARLLLEAVEEQGDVTLIGCDCNSKETSSSYRILADVMKNTARQVGWIVGGVELANGKPDRNLQHIDYLFYRGGLKPLNIYTIQDSGGSDHLPVLARYSFN